MNGSPCCSPYNRMASAPPRIAASARRPGVMCFRTSASGYFGSQLERRLCRCRPVAVPDRPAWDLLPVAAVRVPLRDLADLVQKALFERDRIEPELEQLVVLGEQVVRARLVAWILQMVDLGACQARHELRQVDHAVR